MTEFNCLVNKQVFCLEATQHVKRKLISYISIFCSLEIFASNFAKQIIHVKFDGGKFKPMYLQHLKLYNQEKGRKGNAAHASSYKF